MIKEEIIALESETDEDESESDEEKARTPKAYGNLGNKKKNYRPGSKVIDYKDIRL